MAFRLLTSTALESPCHARCTSTAKRFSNLNRQVRISIFCIVVAQPVIVTANKY